MFNLLATDIQKPPVRLGEWNYSGGGYLNLCASINKNSYNFLKNQQKLIRQKVTVLLNMDFYSSNLSSDKNNATIKKPSKLN